MVVEAAAVLLDQIEVIMLVELELMVVVLGQMLMDLRMFHHMQVVMVERTVAAAVAAAAVGAVLNLLLRSQL